MSADLRRVLTEAGWQQGSLLPKAAVEHATSLEGESAVIITHDCDLLHRDLGAEPIVEAIIAEFIAPEDVDGNLTYGKNPRALDLQLATGSSDKYVRLRMNSRFSVERSALAQFAPDPRNHTDKRGKRIIKEWLARRYGRSALPDEFNLRRAPTANTIRRLARRDGRDLEGLFVTLEQEELVDGEIYEVLITGVVGPQVYADSALRSQADKAIGAIGAALDGCDGISVLDSAVRSSEHVSLFDHEHMVRLDDDDDLSRREP